MNTSLQISLARDHHHQLRRQAAEAQLDTTTRSTRPGAFKSWGRTVRLHAPSVRTKSIRVASR
jgi:hypothetical protein